MRRRSRVAAQEAPAAAYARGYSAGQAASPTPPTFTLGTVADQVDLTAPTMPTISNLVSSGTPTYAWTLTDPLGANASSLLTGATTATPTCAALSTWGGAKLCGRWTGTVTITDSAGSTTKSFGWTVGVGGLRRKTLSYAGQTRNFLTDSTPLSIGGVTLTPYNTGNADVFRFNNNKLEIQAKSGNYQYSTSMQLAPYVVASLTELNPSYTRLRRCFLEFIVSHPGTSSGSQHSFVGFKGESYNYTALRLNGGATQYSKVVAMTLSGDGGESNVNGVVGAVGFHKFGAGYVYYTAGAGAVMQEMAAMTQKKIFASQNDPSETDLYDGGESIIFGVSTSGGTQSLVYFGDSNGDAIRLDVEV